jgi:hypothetical protein
MREAVGVVDPVFEELVVDLPDFVSRAGHGNGFG